MSNIVFVLGAGASKEAGAPLMAEFLGTARDLLAKDQVPNAAEQFEHVFKAIGRLQQVHSKSEFDIHNVESVFAALEMGKTLKRFPGCEKGEGIDALIRDMKVLISTTIENTLGFPINRNESSAGMLECPSPYGAFSELLKHLREKAYPNKTVSVVTFNYDLAADFALDQYALGPDYCLAGPQLKDKVPLLKLHGSLNWARRKDDQRVIAWDVPHFLHDLVSVFPQTESPTFIYVSSHFHRWDQNKHIELQPEIVPPTWNKTDYHRSLSSVWSQSAEELSEAESIFVIGYSLPESDSFFRYLYALGSLSDTPLQRFWVFNPDKTGGVEKRFRDLLGPGARDRFQYIPKAFNDAITIIKHEFPTRKH